MPNARLVIARRSQWPAETAHPQSARSQDSGGDGPCSSTHIGLNRTKDDSCTEVFYEFMAGAQKNTD